MARTTPALVAAIVDTQAGVDLTPFIDTASQMVTDNCTYTAPKTPYSDGYIGSKMELIERWVAAHLYTIFDNQLTSAKAGTVNVGYQYKIDLGLQHSAYGQQAMLLDNFGGLAAWNNTSKTKRRITIQVLGPGRRCFPLGDLFGVDFSDVTVEQ